VRAVAQQVALADAIYWVPTDDQQRINPGGGVNLLFDLVDRTLVLVDTQQQAAVAVEWEIAK
jgi:hypothetical protein